MKRPLRTVLVLLGLLCGTAETRAEAADKPVGRALLVGCTHYPNLARTLQLEGPGNDVLLLRDLLVTRYAFRAADIVILSEAAARAGGPTKRPTRANILRELRTLAEKTARGDRVVILLAGHGTRQPDSKPDDPTRFKPDGLEEVFLPADCGMWDDRAGSVQNAIKDYEFRPWLQRIRARPASLWVIIDACHAASMIRGADEEVMRAVPQAALGITREALDRARERARKVPAKGRPNQPGVFLVPTEEPALVALYAAQSSEATVERPMPPKGAQRRPHGLLTYTLCQVLTQATTPLTHVELAERIRAHYVAWGRTSPIPLVEGKERDREVLGDREHRGRSRITLTADGKGSWRVNAGALHGLSAGSILTVYPPAGEPNAEMLVGYVQVSRAGLGILQAKVEPCAFAGLPAVKALPAGGRCELAFKDFGDLRIPVAVDPHTQAGEPLPAARATPLQQALERLARADEALIVVSPSARQGKWLLRLDALAAGNVYLVPGSGHPLSHGHASPTEDAIAQLPLPFGPAPAHDRIDAWLKDSLEKIARAQNLVSLAAMLSEQQPEEKSGVRIAVELVRFRDRADQEGTPLRGGGAGLVLHRDDQIGFRVRNLGLEPVDVTLLLVDGAYGIQPIYPRSVTVDNRLAPGGKPLQIRGRVTADTVGLEHLVVIAVQAREMEEYANFCFLAQPGLEGARKVRGGGGARDLDSAVGRLFQRALYGRGATRGGLEAGTFEEIAFCLRSWRVLPQPRGEVSLAQGAATDR
jgi:hypothetical protein